MVALDREEEVSRWMMDISMFASDSVTESDKFRSFMEPVIITQLLTSLTLSKQKSTNQRR